MSLILSLNQFFKQKKILPCQVGGRFFYKNKTFFYLKSQDKWILCQNHQKKLSVIKPASWVKVELLYKETNYYQTKNLVILNSPKVVFKEKNYSYQKKGRILQNWQFFLKEVEKFFIKEGLAYSYTPHLVKCPGTEPYLTALKSSFKQTYLTTSPEMHLKRLLCQDWTDFFEIKTCYREEKISPHHQVEFTLLEWYRAFYSTSQLREETYKLISFLSKTKIFKNHLAPFKVFTVSQLFKKYLNFYLTPKTSKKELFLLAQKHQLKCSITDSFEDLFFLLFLNYIEPYFEKEIPTFICDYPLNLRAFSQINKKNGWADRFELYWKGLELANAFYEVIDPLEQKKIFQDHLKKSKKQVPLDEELLKDMQMGMPPVSGIALGLDRLFLALYNKKDLKETRLFPL